MASTTDPTVTLPTATNIDDDDDDDDDVNSLLLPSQPPAQPTVPPATVPAPSPDGTVISNTSSVASVPTSQPPLPPTGSPDYTSTSILNGILPSSATELADNSPNSSPTAVSPTEPTNDGGSGIGPGASAGIGIGAALVVCLAAFGIWFFTRRHRARRTEKRSTSIRSSDEEHAWKAQSSGVYTHRVGNPAEASGDEKPRRWSELESPTCIAEAGGGEVFRVELPGSAIPVEVAGKGTDDRLFPDMPIDVQERAVDRKDERLFSDPPIDEGTDTLEILPKSLEKD